MARADDDTEDTGLAQRIEDSLALIKEGQIGNIDADTPFYILGLHQITPVFPYETGNKAHLEKSLNGLVVTNGSLILHALPKIARTYRSGYSYDKPHESPKKYHLVGRSFAALGAHGGADAILTAVLRRIRAGDDLRHSHAALIKAILIRNYSKEITTMLDENRPEPAYQLGRLFAALEKHRKMPSEASMPPSMPPSKIAIFPPLINTRA